MHCQAQAGQLTCQLRAEKEAPQSSMPTNGWLLAARGTGLRGRITLQSVGWH